MKINKVVNGVCYSVEDTPDGRDYLLEKEEEYLSMKEDENDEESGLHRMD